jgi:hypothetical protein
MTIFTVGGTRHRQRGRHIGLEHALARAEGIGAEGAELADVAVEVHDEGAGRGIAQLGRHLVADALALVHRHALLGAPVARDAVQLFFLGRGRRHHVVDEEHEALGPATLSTPNSSRASRKKTSV